MHEVKAFISDIDGTLLDTLEVIKRGQYEAAITHFHEIGLPQEQHPEYQDYNKALLQVIGGHVRETLESTNLLLYKDRPDVIELLDFDRMAELLRPIQDTLAEDLVRPYAGLQDLLRYIGEQGIAFGIFTSGRPHHLVRNFEMALPELDLKAVRADKELGDYEKLDILAKNLKKVFGLSKIAIITGDDVSAHKPDPEPVYAVLDRLGVKPEYAVAFGDHMVDMKSAAAAGVTRRVGVTHGFDDEEILRQAGASHIVNSLDEFREYLQNQR
ncbi:MAG TPA: HAD hydrolase-like protein [Candidatus Saccharimonadales bacterium]